MEETYRKAGDDFVRLAIIHRLRDVDPQTSRRLAAALRDGTRLPFVRAQAATLAE